MVAAGGALGSAARYGLTLLASQLLVRAEIATLTANVLGSFLIGLAVPDAKSQFTLFYMVGVCGGFTTFSTFSSQTMRMLHDGHFAMGLLYVIASVVISLVMVWCGWWCRNKFL